MINFLKKFLIIFFVYLFVINLFFFSIKKNQIISNQESNQYQLMRKKIYEIINDKKINSTKEGRQYVSIYQKMACFMIGEGCSKNFNDSKNNLDKSFIGLFAKLILLPITHPPASGLYWAYSNFQNAGFIPKIYASEGIGFATIRNFADIWKLFRDISYMLLVIVLIAIGFMIMFRTKINPQTVISVENALPKIIVSIILITFSFAIAGFLIDLMYVLIALVVSVLIKADPNNNPLSTIQNEYFYSSFWDLWIRDIRMRMPIRESISIEFTSSIIKLIPLQIDIPLRIGAGFITGLIAKSFGFGKLVDLIATAFNNMQGVGNSAGNFPQLLIYPIVFLFMYGSIFLYGFFNGLEIIVGFLLTFSILFTAIRISVILFSSYIKLLLIIILGPFLILFEALGKPGFKTWIMGIIGNLIVFPITITIFFLAYIINSNIDTGFTARMPYLYGIESSGFKFLVALGLIFLIPDLIKTTKELLGIKDLPISIGIGTYFGGIGAGVGGAVGTLGQFSTISLGLQAFGFEKGLPGVIKDIKGAFKRPSAPAAGDKSLGEKGGE